MSNYPFVINGDSYNLASFDVLAYITNLPVALGDLVKQLLLLHSGTSVTSTTIGTGSKVFATQAGLAFRINDQVVVASSAAPQTNYMYGIVTAYNFATGSITVNVQAVGGSGTIASWQIGLGGVPFASIGDAMLALDQGGTGGGRNSVLGISMFGLGDPGMSMAEIYEEFAGSQGDKSSGANSGQAEPPWYNYNTQLLDIFADPTNAQSTDVNSGYMLVGCDTPQGSLISGYMKYGQYGFMHVGRGLTIYETKLFNVYQSGTYNMACGLMSNGTGVQSGMFRGGGIGFSAYSGYNNGRYVCHAGADGLDKTILSGVVPQPSPGAYDTLRFEVDADGRAVDFFINTSYIGQIAGNLPINGSNNLLMPAYEAQLIRVTANTYATSAFYVDSLLLRKFLVR